MTSRVLLAALVAFLVAAAVGLGVGLLAGARVPDRRLPEPAAHEHLHHLLHVTPLQHAPEAAERARAEAVCCSCCDDGVALLAMGACPG